MVSNGLSLSLDKYIYYNKTQTKVIVTLAYWGAQERAKCIKSRVAPAARALGP